MVSMGAVKLDVFQVCNWHRPVSSIYQGSHCVFSQKTLADFQASAGQGIQPTPEPILSTSKQQQIPQPTHIPLHSTTPVPAVPPYLRDQPPNPYSNPYRTATPPHATPTPPMASAPPVQPPYGAYQNGYHHHQSAPSHGAYPTPGPSGPPQYGSSAPAGGYPGYGPPSTQQAPAPDLAATLAAIPDEQKALVLRVVQMTPEQIHALPPQERGTYIQIVSVHFLE